MTDMTILPSNSNGVITTDSNGYGGNWNGFLSQHVTNGQVASALASNVTNQHVTNEANQTRAMIAAGFAAIATDSALAKAVQLQDAKSMILALQSKAGYPPSA